MAANAGGAFVSAVDARSSVKMQAEPPGLKPKPDMTLPPCERPEIAAREGRGASCRQLGAVAPDFRRRSGFGAPLLWLLLASVIGLGRVDAIAAERIGIVLLHGKTGTPGQFATMAETMNETGYGVETPEMCWSNRRIYDAPLSDCFADVDAAIGRLRADGFTKIVVGGHSLGGLAALAYAGSHDGLAGIALLAPDGEPGDFNTHAAVARSVADALKRAKDGRGDDDGTFTDRVLGRDFTVKATANAFLSFLGPDSALAPSLQLPKLNVPLFWAAGTKDSSQNNAPALFKRAPAKGLSVFVKVNAAHIGTPSAAYSELTDWLDRLAGK
jgi:esterase/lipase